MSRPTQPGSRLDGLEEAARAALPAPVFEYVSQGARDGVVAAEATAAWRAHRMRPRVLRDVRDVDLTTDLLGHRAAVPWAVAPSTLQRAIHPEGELAMARACADAGALMVVSSNAGTSLADIGATGVAWWAQLYVPQDRSLGVPFIEKAVAAGARALVLTVDTPVVSTKYTAGDPVWSVIDPEIVGTNLDSGFDAVPGAEKAKDLAAEDISWLQDVSGLPVVVKGVLRGDDAVACVEAGAAAVWVSNHGGRQLDRAVATATALPEVVSSVPRRVPVYVDGGVRSGLDLLTAIALGAHAVFLGRLPMYALLGGADGVAQLHADLREEVAEALRLAGCRTPAEARTSGLLR